MPAHEAAHNLVGLALDGGWTVVERIERAPDLTGGTFSVGYIVEAASGQRAYLKALDYSDALEAGDIPRALEEATTNFNHERDLVRRCEIARLTRIVRALNDGQVRVEGVGGIPQVNYLIFELADGDVREAIASDAASTIGWKLRSLHQVSLGLFQLHRHGMAHQDIKPSNVLIFDRTESKIGDLGRAAYRNAPSPFDDFLVVGDYTYAPPELLYREVRRDWERKCQACDMYLLGSFALYLFSGVGMTGAIMSRLDHTLHWRRWAGTYRQVLPYVRDAFDHVVEMFERDLLPDLRGDLTATVRELCDPDPDVRGHPRSRAGLGSSFSLERFVAGFALMLRRAEVAGIDRIAA
jgi:eukaryotic-like serine/threonine-protein kinase